MVLNLPDMIVGAAVEASEAKALEREPLSPEVVIACLAPNAMPVKVMGESVLEPELEAGADAVAEAPAVLDKAAAALASASAAGASARLPAALAALLPVTAGAVLALEPVPSIEAVEDFRACLIVLVFLSISACCCNVN